MNYINNKINELADIFFKGNNSKFAEQFNTSEANIRNYRKNIIPKIDFIIKLYNMLEINFEWILLDKGPMLINDNEMLANKEEDYERITELRERITELKSALHDKNKIITILEEENLVLKSQIYEDHRNSV